MLFDECDVAVIQYSSDEVTQHILGCKENELSSCFWIFEVVCKKGVARLTFCMKRVRNMQKRSALLTFLHVKRMFFLLSPHAFIFNHSHQFSTIYDCPVIVSHQTKIHL